MVWMEYSRWPVVGVDPTREEAGDAHEEPFFSRGEDALMDAGVMCHIH